MNGSMKNFYVTFGLGSPFSDMVLSIRGRSEEEVRDALNRTTKGWCSILDNHQYQNLAANTNHTLVQCPKDAIHLGLH